MPLDTALSTSNQAAAYETADRLPAGTAIGLPHRLEQAFARFPNSVARDRRVSPGLLVTLAYRATIVGSWVLQESDLRKLVRDGLGKNAARRAIAEGKELGLLKRWQQPGPHKGKFGTAKEVLNLPECGESGYAYRTVQRRWFDGSLTAKELAALLYLRAGTGKGPDVYARELATRFGWSRPTAGGIITTLTRRGLLDKTVTHHANGQFGATTYVVPRLSAGKLSRSEATVKKPGNGSRGNGFAGNLLTSMPPDAPLTGEPPSRTSSKEEGHHIFRCADDVRAVGDSEDAEDRAWRSSNILGWVTDGSIADGRWGDEFLECVTPELVELVSSALDDRELVARIRAAASGRVHRSILSAAGAYGVRYLAAFVLSHHEEDPCPVEAIKSVLQAIIDRIGGRPGEWLNSLEVIGQRIAGELYSGSMDGSRFYSAGTPDRESDGFAAENASINDEYMPTGSPTRRRIAYRIADPPPDRLPTLRAQLASEFLSEGRYSVEQAQQLAGIIFHDEQSMPEYIKYVLLALAERAYRASGDGLPFDFVLTPEDTRWAVEQATAYLSREEHNHAERRTARGQGDAAA